MDKAFAGRWRMIDMEQWDLDFIEAEGEGHITFLKKGGGSFRFGAVEGELDCRYDRTGGRDVVAFSWEGREEMEPAFGRGTAWVENGALHGCIYFHRGEESGFRAVRKLVLC